MQKTRSPDLKAALCGAYVRIAKLCPLHIWKPELLLNILCSPKLYYGLVECFEVALSILDPYLVGETDNGQDCSYASPSVTSGCEPGSIGEKRPLHPPDVLNAKRQKYASIRTIETKNVADDQQWLTNWVLYSMITLFELTFAALIEW
ncbi:hypothetical protein Hdeb2414_s0008g00278421 [Helianthus debilis subsp. tardiflorus]